VADGSPTVRRRELGALLRRLREEKGFTVKQVTEHLLCSPSKVSRIETGQRGATQRDVRDLCDLYGVTDEAERGRLMQLARESKQQGWWQSYDLPFGTPTYVGLEAEAVRIREFDCGVISGLLQTPDYVRALHLNPMPEPPPREVTPNLVDQRVEARLIRQQLLTGRTPSPLNFWTVLDEAVLHRVIGGPAVMQSQLQFVVDRMLLDNLTVQVLPFGAGAHPATGSSFSIMEFSGDVLDIVYSEGLEGFMFMERPEEITMYDRVFERLSSMAMNQDQSAEFILKLSKTYESALNERVDHR
jgi:transcriptional regulator with XRE-family HTH domain